MAQCQKFIQENVAECQKPLADIAEQEGARFQEIDKFEIEQSQESCLLKEQVAKLAEDKKALEERYKSLQEKSKASAKKQKEGLRQTAC
ncbi:uncharacterized protein LOC120660566 isoform X2 [Panicum virgatum]|uniref:uncharacterized protein LOC120660566 isoform X2 n=1 Tax=Panicum virgatum TaxID=38727 RepID=UPI0019D5640E|nr:uncharacterized protein LOC120660566 isoform X2 [Panicum virgatum]